MRTRSLREPLALLGAQRDERLVARIRAGEETAFEALFDRYRARLLAFCRGMLRSNEDAEDVLQEVFAAAHAAMLADDRAIEVRPWLYRIARNRCLNHLRRPLPESTDTLDAHPHDNGITTEERAASREELRTLVASIRELPETQRRALLLRELEALSYDQIARTMETSVSAVKSLLVRARTHLRGTTRGLGALAPAGPIIWLKQALGLGGHGGGGTSAGAASGAASGTAASGTAAAAGGLGIAGSKAAAGLALAVFLGTGGLPGNPLPTPPSPAAIAGAAAGAAETSAAPQARAPGATGPTPADAPEQADQRSQAGHTGTERTADSESNDTGTIPSERSREAEPTTASDPDGDGETQTTRGGPQRPPAKADPGTATRRGSVSSPPRDEAEGAPLREAAPEPEPEPPPERRSADD